MHNSHNGTASSLDLPRLAKVCELLTSQHAGERAAAADRATAMLVAADITWTDLILRERVTSSEKSASEAHYSSNTTAYSNGSDTKSSTKYTKSSTKHGLIAADMISKLYGKLEGLIGWDQKFISNLHDLDLCIYGNALTLSDSQWAQLIRIARKTGVIVGAPA
jgi:hypothetical protein